MATEKGVVIDSDSDTALVKTSRSASCQSCSSRHSCGVSHNGKDMEVEAINDIGAKTGDHVVLNVDTVSLLKASFLLYVFPIILMLAGALLGQYLGPVIGQSSGGTSAVIAFLFFFLSFGFVRYRGNKMAEKREYKPKIIRILRKG